MAAPCSQWIACSPVRNGIVAGRSTQSLERTMSHRGAPIHQHRGLEAVAVAALEVQEPSHRNRLAAKVAASQLDDREVLEHSVSGSSFEVQPTNQGRCGGSEIGAF